MKLEEDDILLKTYSPTNKYMLKVSNMKARKKCKICSELTMKTLERLRSGVFIINFEHIIQLLLSLLLTLNK